MDTHAQCRPDAGQKAYAGSIFVCNVVSLSIARCKQGARSGAGLHVGLCDTA